MKTFLLCVLGASLLSLAACQTSSTPEASRNFELMGTNQRFATELPASNAAASANAPYALTGSQNTGFAVPDRGYQSRN